jgi:copper homeostasis protein
VSEILLEVCVDSADGLAAAFEGGADRIELCSALELGGLTPSYGLMKLAAKVPLPVHCMIRPRGGGFCYGEADIAQMLLDIDMARDLGLSGVVFGALTDDGELDSEFLDRLVRHADGLDLTLHRAFDCCGPDVDRAIDTAIDLGFDRILTSGGEKTALEGLPALMRIFAKAGNRITIMPGSGINAGNLTILLCRLPIREIHASCSVARSTEDGAERQLGFAGETMRQTDVAKIRDLKAALAKR